MKKIFIVFLLFPLCLFAQKNYFDSLKAELRKSINDSLKLQLYITLGLEYGPSNPDSAIHYALENIRFVTSKRDKLPIWADWNSSYVLGMALLKACNYPDAQNFFKATETERIY